MGYPVKQSQTAQPLLFFMVDDTDHVTGKTGLSPTVTISKNGGGFGAVAGAITEIANGWYKVAGNATDTDTLGPLALHATGTAADPYDDFFTVVAYNPQDSVRLGLTALPNAAAEAAGGLYTRGTGAGQINQAANGQIDANAVGISGDATAADNAELFFDGTGYTATNSVIGHVAVVDSIAGNAINAAAIAADAIGTTEVSAALIAAISDAIWDEVLSGHLTGGTTGAALNGAASAGDPWLTNLPGAYSSGSAGFILGTNLNTTISSRLAPTVAGRTLDVTATGAGGIDWGNVENQSTVVGLSGTTVKAVTDAVLLSAASVDLIWDEVQAGHVTAGSFGVYLDAPISGIGSSASAVATAVWATVMDGYDASDLMCFIAAACAGKLSGAATGTEIIRSADDTANRISATVDRLGNRTAITLTPP